MMSLPNVSSFLDIEPDISYPLVIMDQTDYRKTWEALVDDRIELDDQRTTLETELSEIKTKIAHLSEVISHLGPLAGVVLNNENFSGLGITAAIREVLKSASNPMSATDIRIELAEKGFDFSGHTAVMSSIYKVLSRLVEDSKVIERIAGDSPGRVSYRWIRADYGDTGITDDDIPF